MKQTELYEIIFESAINILREKYYKEDNAIAIPRDDQPHWD